MAAKTPGSGRKKGTPNKETQTLEERAEALGVDPFHILLLFAKGDSEALGYSKYDGIPIKIRSECAKELCQYLLPKRKAVEITTGTEGFRIIVEDYGTKKE